MIVARFDGEGLHVDGHGAEDDVAHRPLSLPDPNRTPALPGEIVASDEATLKVRTGGFEKRATPPPGIVHAPVEREIETDPLEVPTLETIEAAKPDVSPARRSRGMMIAIALLALLVVFATCYAVRAVRNVQPEPTAPSPSVTTP